LRAPVFRGFVTRRALTVELAEVQRKLDRLVDALLADGSLPADEIKPRLSSEKARKEKLAADLERFDQVARIAAIDPAEINRQIQARVSDVTASRRQTIQARQMLRRLLAGKIELEPVGSGRERAYKFRGALTIEKLIAGEAVLSITHPAMVAPTGFEPVFESRSRFRQVSYVVTDQQHPATSTRLKHAAESSLKHRVS